MKTLQILILALFVCTISVAQDLKPTEVPDPVKSAFTTANAKATDVEWERDMDNYKVEFDVGRMEHEIWYSPTGEIIKREVDIAQSDLPQAVKDAINSKYSGYRIDDIEMTWMDNKTTYEVELEKGKEEWKVVYDEKGNIINEKRD